MDKDERISKIEEKVREFVKMRDEIEVTKSTLAKAQAGRRGNQRQIRIVFHTRGGCWRTNLYGT